MRFIGYLDNLRYIFVYFPLLLGLTLNKMAFYHGRWLGWGFAKQGTRSAPPRIETLLVGK